MRTYHFVIAGMLLVFGISSCASEEQRLIESGANKLGTNEIDSTFSGTVEEFVGKGEFYGVNATSVYNEDGSFSATWTSNTDSGKLDGTWYAENDMRCIVYTEPPGSLPNPDCVKLFDTGGGSYTMIDGKGAQRGSISSQKLAE